MAGRTFDLVFSVEHFFVGGFEKVSAGRHVEKSGCATTGETAAGVVGRIHPVVFFADVWIAHGILQLRGLASDWHAAWDRVGARGRSGHAMADVRARRIGGRGSVAWGGVDCHGGDFLESSGTWGYILVAGAPAAGCV